MTSRRTIDTVTDTFVACHCEVLKVMTSTIRVSPAQLTNAAPLSPSSAGRDSLFNLSAMFERATTVVKLPTTSMEEGSAQPRGLPRAEHRPVFFCEGSLPPNRTCDISISSLFWTLYDFHSAHTDVLCVRSEQAV